MRDFVFHIEDDRYTVPTLEFVAASSEAAARGLAAERLHASKHHLAIEAYEDDRLLFRIGQAAAARPVRRVERSAGQARAN